MQPGMRNRFRIAVLIYSMINAVIFGAGIITVLNVSALRARLRCLRSASDPKQTSLGLLGE